MVQLFQVAIRLHPRHPELTTLTDSFNAPVQRLVTKLNHLCGVRLDFQPFSESGLAFSCQGLRRGTRAHKTAGNRAYFGLYFSSLYGTLFHRKVTTRVPLGFPVPNNNYCRGVCITNLSDFLGRVTEFR